VRAQQQESETIFLAREKRAGEGIPLAVKDLFDTAGLRTTYGSILFAEHVPARTAEAVVRLEQAGFVTVGKTNLHEFAYGVSSDNPHFGRVPNPIAPDRTAGGSSGGSAAALAAGLADAALGSDSGGSIRIPAACTPDDLGSLEELEVGVAWSELADPLVHERIEAAARCFPRRRVVAFPFPEKTAAVFMREAAESHSGLFPEHADAYGDNVRTKLERCLRVTDSEFDTALRRREDYRERAAEAIDGLDLVITPTLQFVAPAADRDELDIRDAMIRLTYPFNVLGWPALALPCGPAERGLPASVQLIGRRGDDGRVIAAGDLLETTLASTI
jgi:aspartyl-tRNA(Asn)/glutamyl-tRNA(Gln) amidotransferase subunit A